MQNALSEECLDDCPSQPRSSSHADMVLLSHNADPTVTVVQIWYFSSTISCDTLNVASWCQCPEAFPSATDLPLLKRHDVPLEYVHNI